jgi:CRP-like cAMP-binding protein
MMDSITDNCISLKNSELFAGLPSSVFKELVACARPKDFASSDVMFFVDDPIRQVLLLTEGLVKKSQLSQGGREAILRLTVPGEVISELALVSGGTHSSTAQALQDCKVLVWDSATFEAASVRFPGLRRNAHHILERRLAELEYRFCVVSTKTASPRLASGLVQLMDHLGQRVNHHIEINIKQEVLAQMTGMTSFQVCHLLNLWKVQGVVKLRKETIEIHSVPGLMDLCRAKQWRLLFLDTLSSVFIAGAGRWN